MCQSFPPLFHILTAVTDPAPPSQEEKAIIYERCFVSEEPYYVDEQHRHIDQVKLQLSWDRVKRGFESDIRKNPKSKKIPTEYLYSAYVFDDLEAGKRAISLSNGGFDPSVIGQPHFDEIKRWLGI